MLCCRSKSIAQSLWIQNKKFNKRTRLHQRNTCEYYDHVKLNTMNQYMNASVQSKLLPGKLGRTGSECQWFMRFAPSTHKWVSAVVCNTLSMQRERLFPPFASYSSVGSQNKLNLSSRCPTMVHLKSALTFRLKAQFVFPRQTLDVRWISITTQQDFAF